MLEKVNLAAAFEELQAPWVPRTVASYNGDHVQVVLVEGEFVWHHHDRTDDLFLVVDGRVTVQLRDGDVELGPGEMLVVPVGVEHCVRAEGGPARLVVLEHLGETLAAPGEATLPSPLSRF